MIAAKMSTSESEEELIKAFKVFDKDGNGIISNAEFRRIMSTLGDCLEAEQINEMIREADMNKDGEIHYATFVKKIFCKNSIV